MDGSPPHRSSALALTALRSRTALMLTVAPHWCSPFQGAPYGRRSASQAPRADAHGAPYQDRVGAHGLPALVLTPLGSKAAFAPSPLEPSLCALS